MLWLTLLTDRSLIQSEEQDEQPEAGEAEAEAEADDSKARAQQIVSARDSRGISTSGASQEPPLHLRQG